MVLHRELLKRMVSNGEPASNMKLVRVQNGGGIWRKTRIYRTHLASAKCSAILAENCLGSGGCGARTARCGHRKRAYGACRLAARRVGASLAAIKTFGR
jgi:hypothetical protein